MTKPALQQDQPEPAPERCQRCGLVVAKGELLALEPICVQCAAEAAQLEDDY
jgi:hypothetical protein